jgi:hypothetical protein
LPLICSRGLSSFCCASTFVINGVGYMIRISKPTAAHCFQAAQGAVEFVLGLLVIPQRYGLMYQYKALAERYIRLLMLSRRSLWGDFRKRLIHVPLKEPPAYGCIYYVWGDSAKTYPVLIDGLRPPVTTNVYSILRGRASLWSSRLLWIDAICINQNDEKEKAKQVRQCELYKKPPIESPFTLEIHQMRDFLRLCLRNWGLRMGSYEPEQQWREIKELYTRHQEIKED